MKKMKCWLSGILVIVVICLGGIEPTTAAAGGGDGGERYIGWGDLLVDGQRKGIDFNNGTRVIIVDKNGTGDSLTVQGAVDLVSHGNDERVKIHIHPAIYREKVFVPHTKPYISFIGDVHRISDTVISWHDKSSDKDDNGNEIGTFRTASVTVAADYFCASGITVENTAKSVVGQHGRQAVALHIAGEKAVFFRVRFIGVQDTLLDNKGTHYFFLCQIQGSIDFIFGSARSLYDQCVITSTAERYGAIAAHHRESPDENTGFSFIRCVINGSGKVLLGRAWGNYSRTIYSYSFMQDVIAPAGWSDWEDPARQRTASFGQFHCRGAGARTKGRVTWSKDYSFEEAKPFLDTGFIDGKQWLLL